MAGGEQEFVVSAIEHRPVEWGVFRGDPVRVANERDLGLRLELKLMKRKPGIS